MAGNIRNADFNGQPVVALDCGRGGRAVVSLLGGQVLSWAPAGGEEWLYLSDAARFDGAQAIRGGVPVCFPQFATLGKLPKHGIARTRAWTIDQQRSGDDYALLTLRLEDDDATWSVWPQGFRVELSVLVSGDRLDLELEVENTGHAPFAFTGALHSYLRVAEVEHCRLHGLQGHTYKDALANGASVVEAREAVVPDGPIDRIYMDSVGPLVLEDGKRSLTIRQEGFRDVVVWNPWDVGCRALSDMPPLGFRHMLCVEAAIAGRREQLDAGECWVGRQTLVAN